VTSYGNLGDPASALWIFLHFPSKSTRSWNVLLGALAKSSELQGAAVLDLASSNASRHLPSRVLVRSSQILMSTFFERATSFEAIQIILDIMSNSIVVEGLNSPPANSQSYCLAASALQYSMIDSSKARELFRHATNLGIPADGRFINAVFRCYGDDVDGALNDWKNEIRPRCVSCDNNTLRTTLGQRKKGENFLASYNGLLYVCGRALRPDIALRLIYAMKKEGLETKELSLNSYKSGKRIRNLSSGLAAQLVEKLKLISAYESLLEVECSKFDQNDSRRKGEPRVRIIV
jgi:pentatricopeptide repeat protein